MGAPEISWDALHPDQRRRALNGGGFAVRGRQARPDELWLSVELPDHSWSYVVLRDGRVVANEKARSKREAFTRAVESVGS